MAYKNPDGPNESIRAHAAALGYGELDRLAVPLEEMRAEQLFLLEDPDDNYQAWYKRHDIDLDAWIDDLDAQVKRIRVPLWNVGSVGATMRALPSKYHFEEIQVNISCGPKTFGIGATLASLFAPLRLYYANVEYDVNGPADEAKGWPVIGHHRVPTFRLDAWQPGVLACLQVLRDADKRISHKELRQKLQATKPPALERTDEANGPNRQAVYARQQALLKPLLTHGLVKETRPFGRRSFKITPQGETALLLFSDMHRRNVA